MAIPCYIEVILRASHCGDEKEKFSRRGHVGFYGIFNLKKCAVQAAPLAFRGISTISINTPFPALELQKLFVGMLPLWSIQV